MGVYALEWCVVDEGGVVWVIIGVGYVHRDCGGFMKYS